MRNRISEAITKIQFMLTAKGLPLDHDASFLDMSMEEFCKFQELKSIAVSSGVLSVDEGMTMYKLMGELPSVFNSQPYAEKAALTKVFEELLRAK